MLNLYTVLLSCFTNVSALLYYWATHRCIFLIISIQYLSYCVILLHICILLDNKGIPIENKVENEHSHCVKNPPIRPQDTNLDSKSQCEKYPKFVQLCLAQFRDWKTISRLLHKPAIASLCKDNLEIVQIASLCLTRTRNTACKRGITFGSMGICGQFFGRDDSSVMVS